MGNCVSHHQGTQIAVVWQCHTYFNTGKHYSPFLTFSLSPLSNPHNPSSIHFLQVVFPFSPTKNKDQA